MNYTFVRYGKLHPVKQKGYGGDSFHSPPARRGMYAMPLGYESMFIVGPLDKTQSKLHQSLPTITKNERIGNSLYTYDTKDLHVQKHYFTLKGHQEIWHHLYEHCKPHEVLQRHNDWVLTTVKVWHKSLMKETLTNRLKTSSGASWGYKGNPAHISEVSKNGVYCTDSLEVFVEYKV